MSNDGAHTTGGGIIVQWNWFGLPSAAPVDLVFYSGTPGDYTTGDHIAWERNPGGGEWYVLYCTVASPTLQPVKDGNANWARRGEHTDIINPRASIGAGTTIQYNYIKDNWVQAMLDGEAVSIADVNNAMRFVRNSGDLAPFNSCVVRGNKNTRYLNTPSFPFQIGTGSGMTGPVDFIDNRIGTKSGGGWYTGNTSIWGTFSGNTNSTTGAPLSQP